MSKITSYLDSYPVIDTEQMIEVDRLMLETYHIELIQMMENAGRCLAIVAKDHFFEGSVANKHCIILAGTGGNGGGALVCARRLANWGAQVEVFVTAAKEKMTPIPAHQATILENMGVSINFGQNITPKKATHLIIDGIIGYSIAGDPYGIPKSFIDWANQQSTPVLSLDTPSGLDLTSGTIHHPTIKANATLTLALPKKGLFSKEVIPIRGELFLGDISVPPNLYLKPTLSLVVPNIFEFADIVWLPDDKG